MIILSQGHSDPQGLTSTSFGIFYFGQFNHSWSSFQKTTGEKDDVNQGEKIKESLELTTIDTNEIKQVQILTKLSTSEKEIRMREIIQNHNSK